MYYVFNHQISDWMNLTTLAAALQIKHLKDSDQPEYCPSLIRLVSAVDLIGI